MESDRLFSPGFVPQQSLALVSHNTEDNQTLISNQQVRQYFIYNPYNKETGCLYVCIEESR